MGFLFFYLRYYPQIKNFLAEIFEAFAKIISSDNLRVRTSPDLDSENLPLNTVVEYLDKKSEHKTEVTIKGKKINEYWYQIKTPSGNIGWIHGCCFEEK